MTTLLIVIHVLSCIMLILVVLLQAGRGADMGAAFGGASTAMFGSGSASNPLARMTTITAVLFLTTALFLAVASARRASVFDSTPEPLAVTPQAESSPPAGMPGSEGNPIMPSAKPLTIPPAGESAPADAAPAGEAPVAVPGAAPADGAAATPPAASGNAAAPAAAPAVPADAPAAAPAVPADGAPKPAAPVVPNDGAPKATAPAVPQDGAPPPAAPAVPAAPPAH